MNKLVFTILQICFIVLLSACNGSDEVVGEGAAGGDLSGDLSGESLGESSGGALNGQPPLQDDRNADSGEQDDQGSGSSSQDGQNNQSTDPVNPDPDNQNTQDVVHEPDTSAPPPVPTSHIVLDIENAENLEDHLGTWRMNVDDTRDFHIFQEAGVILEARFSVDDGAQNINPSLYLHYFSKEDDGSLMAWAQRQVGNYHVDNVATLDETVQIESEWISINELLPPVLPTLDGWVLHVVPYQTGGFAHGEIFINSFTTSAGVAVVEPEDYIGIPFDEPASIVFGEEGMENRETHLVWFPLRISDTRDFHIFQDDWVILEVRLSEPKESETDFNISVYAHYFLEEFGGSLEAWANNQYSDGLMIDFAVHTETIELPPSIASIVSVSDNGHTTIDDAPLYQVEYFIDNYSDSFISFSSFTTNANVAVTPEVEMVALPIESADRRIAFNGLPPEYGHYGITRVFYVFDDESAVIRVLLNNLDGEMEVDARLEVFLFEPGADIGKWINNQTSDALEIDPPSPIYSRGAPIVVTHNIFEQESELGYGLFTVRYQVDDYTDGRILLEEFSGIAEVAVEPRNFEGAPVVGICVHTNEDAVLHLESATGNQSGTEYSEVILDDFSINGVSVSIESVIRETSENVVLSENGNSIRCTLPCSFGEEVGEWKFNASAPNDISTAQSIMADYDTFVGGCPSFSDNGTHTHIGVNESMETIQGS